jgi:thioredoxin-related protein/tetratricopeptide (TPR) repeat protein
LRKIYSITVVAALFSSVSLLTPSLGRCEEGLWQTDFTAAKAEAKSQKKLLLVDFTGSDWCGWCIKLHKEVFDKDTFKEAAPKNFVLVELDFPHKKKLAPELKEQNDKLAKEYNVQGFPTVLLLDPEGKVVAKTGYKDGGPEKYVDSLASMVKAHDKVVKLMGELAGASGEAKAKLLDKLIDAKAVLGVEDDETQEWMKEIIALDADDKAGLKEKYEVRLALDEFKSLMEERKFDAASEAVEKLLAMKGLSDEQKQEIYMDRFQCLRMKGDLAGCVQSLKDADKAVPDGSMSLRIKSMLKQLESMAKLQAKALELKADLEKAKDADRATALDKVLDAYAKVGNQINFKPQTEQVEKWTKEIIELDADNKAGMKSKYESVALLNEGQKLLMQGKTAKALQAFDKALAVEGINAEQIQRISMMKVQCCLIKGDAKGALAAANKGIEAAPDSEMAATLKQFVARIKMQEKQKED